jgi:acetyl-CoA synthetase
MTYESVVSDFEWQIPPLFNCGTACSDEQDPNGAALRVIAGTERQNYTFGDLSALSDRLATHLGSLGIERGDRVGLVLPQALETGLMHLALWKLGAVSLPLAAMFGPDAIQYRLEDSGATHVVTNEANRAKVTEAKGEIPMLLVEGLLTELASVDPIAAPVETSADDPGYLIYTSGTTGQPKGALHAHRSLFGHLPGFESYYEFAPQPDDLIWTPADWAWIGGLMDVLIPAWYHGIEVLTTDHDFDPNWALGFMAEQRVTLAFLPPTALKMMRASGARQDGLSLRAIFTGGEPLGEEMLVWAEEVLGARINEGYGQTECNLVIGNCGSVWSVRPGSMGKALPGHTVAVLDDDGNRVIGEEGEICVQSPNPVMMLEYWNRPDATRDKYRDGWLLTGDIGVEDEEGYLWFRSRRDDVISSMGYRIGPGEIEESLMGHPAVALCAVVGVPDDIRGHVPAAFVVLNSGVHGSEELASELQQHVRTRLAPHEVPRRVTFVDDLPRTTTGKIMRRALRSI